MKLSEKFNWINVESHLHQLGFNFSPSMKLLNREKTFQLIKSYENFTSLLDYLYFFCIKLSFVYIICLFSFKSTEIHKGDAFLSSFVPVFVWLNCTARHKIYFLIKLSEKRFSGFFDFVFCKMLVYLKCFENIGMLTCVVLLKFWIEIMNKMHLFTFWNIQIWSKISHKKSILWLLFDSLEPINNSLQLSTPFRAIFAIPSTV